MKILVAAHSGFCYGVKRAVQILDELIEEHDENHPIYTLGPIIHNKQVTEFYEERGVKVIENLSVFNDNGVGGERVVIRSHGAPKKVYDDAEKMQIEILDATCPYVKKIQNTVSTYASKGYNIIIVGDSDHPEVIGIDGWCDHSATIIEKIEDAEKLMDSDAPVCIVAQTTFNLALWKDITEVLKKKFPNGVIHNTICLATEQRQQACRELAEQVDYMIVIGGKHSSNTIKLANICSNVVKTIHIETKDELDLSILRGDEVIGITAGASTPDWIVQSVILKIENEGEVYFDGKS